MEILQNIQVINYNCNKFRVTTDKLTIETLFTPHKEDIQVKKRVNKDDSTDPLEEI